MFHTLCSLKNGSVLLELLVHPEVKIFANFSVKTHLKEAWDDYGHMPNTFEQLFNTVSDLYCFNACPICFRPEQMPVLQLLILYRGGHNMKWSQYERFL